MVREHRRQFAKSLDGQLPTTDQLRQFERMTTYAFLEIRNTRDIDLANAVADAFHNLPVVATAPDFSWSWQLLFLEILEQQYPEVGRVFLPMFDDIIRFRVIAHRSASGSPGVSGPETLNPTPRSGV